MTDKMKAEGGPFDGKLMGSMGNETQAVLYTKDGAETHIYKKINGHLIYIGKKRKK